MCVGKLNRSNDSTDKPLIPLEFKIHPDPCARMEVSLVVEVLVAHTPEDFEWAFGREEAQRAQKVRELLWTRPEQAQHVLYQESLLGYGGDALAESFMAPDLQW